MWVTSLLRRPNTKRPRSSRLRSFVPQLEILEDRTVPSTLSVTNNLDKGAGSLRDTITAAKSGDTILFAPSLDGQTITLTSDQLTINKSLDIEGPGASLLAISGNDTNRVFNINEGFSVTIDCLTITHGRASGGSTTAGGGGILNAGSTLTLAHDVLSYNVDLGSSTNVQGGAIGNFHKDGILTVTDCTFIGNQADGRVKNSDFAEGGAIYNSPEGSSATVIRCSFIGNQALAGNDNEATTNTIEVGEANGGALHNEGPSTLTVVDSTFIGNQALGGNGGSGGQGVSFYIVDTASGGAIADDVASGALVVSGCTFSYNQARGGSNGTGGSTGQGIVGAGDGGALGIEGPVTVTNSTFDHNEALGGSDNRGSSSDVVGRGVGGAIQNVSIEGTQATLTLGNSAFTDNQAVGGAGNTGSPFAGEGIGGGLDNNRGATATLTGCTFTGNQSVGGAGAPGGPGGNGLGGGIANVLGSILTVSGCTLSGNSATGGAGGSGANGGNGFGGGIYSDGQSTLTVTASSVTSSSATGGAAGSGGSAGQGVGGGVYFATGGVVCLDLFTSMNIDGNTASTINNDIFGVFTICP